MGHGAAVFRLPRDLSADKEREFRKCGGTSPRRHTSGSPLSKDSFGATSHYTMCDHRTATPTLLYTEHADTRARRATQPPAAAQPSEMTGSHITTSPSSTPRGPAANSPQPVRTTTGTATTRRPPANTAEPPAAPESPAASAASTNNWGGHARHDDAVSTYVIINQPPRQARHTSSTAAVVAAVAIVAPQSSHCRPTAPHVARREEKKPQTSTPQSIPPPPDANGSEGGPLLHA